MKLEALRLAFDEIKKGENTQFFWEVVQKIDGRLGSNYEPDPDWTDAVEQRAEQRKEKMENELNAYWLRFKPCSATLILASPPISSAASRRLTSEFSHLRLLLAWLLLRKGFFCFLEQRIS